MEITDRKRRAEDISSIVLNIIAIIILYKLPDWNPGWLTAKYNTVMYVLVLNCVLQVAGNIFTFILDYRAIRCIAGMIMEAGSFVAQISLYFIYPLDFSNYPGWTWIDTVFPWLLIIGMIVSAVKAISYLWKLIVGRKAI